MIAEDAVRATVQAYFNGVNAEDYASVARLFTPQGTLIAPGTKPRVGQEAIADYFAAALRPYPEHDDHPTRVVVAGATATVEITFTGALANGHALSFDAVDVFDLDDDGRIARLSSWYDSHQVRRDLKAAAQDNRTSG